MWIRPDVPVTNPNKPHIEADLIVTGHVHLDDDKTYVIEKGQIKPKLELNVCQQN